MVTALSMEWRNASKLMNGANSVAKEKYNKQPRTRNWVGAMNAIVHVAQDVLLL